MNWIQIVLIAVLFWGGAMTVLYFKEYIEYYKYRRCMNKLLKKWTHYAHLANQEERAGIFSYHQAANELEQAMYERDKS